MRMRGVDPVAFQSFYLDISRKFYVIQQMSDIFIKKSFFKLSKYYPEYCCMSSGNNALSLIGLPQALGNIQLHSVE